jgi:hypothetical protein
MTLLVEQNGGKQKKTIMLTEWPQSLVEALRAGILTGKAEEEARSLEPYHRRPHPWRQYPSAMTRHTDTSFRA